MYKKDSVKKGAILLLGTMFLFFSNGRWFFALAAWLYPLFLLRYTRQQKPIKDFIVTSVLFAVCSQIAFLKFTSPYPASILYYLPAFLGPIYGLLFTLDSMMYHRLKGVVSTLVFPLSYVAVEFLITLANPLGNTGMLAYSQYQILPVMQLASITGTFGITFLIVWFGSLVNWFYDNKENFHAIKSFVFLYLILMISVFTFGSLRLILPDSNQATVRIAGVHVFDLRGQGGCSAFDCEPIDKKHYDKTRRIVRGLFKSTFGLVNSDVNGSLNILRKEEKCIPQIVQTMKDKGSVSSPLRVRVAC